ncbi:hypothetical protein TNCV_3924901 [Trichonephila clavipes]|nr:hypothetical protein TNCV_3924901 [Trichonephila clavipes]
MEECWWGQWCDDDASTRSMHSAERPENRDSRHKKKNFTRHKAPKRTSSAFQLILLLLPAGLSREEKFNSSTMGGVQVCQLSSET